MTPRERLQRIYERGRVHFLGDVNIYYKEDAAALRELDQLIQDMRGIIKVYALDAQSRHPKIVEAILERATQAGYGEK